MTPRRGFAAAEAIVRASVIATVVESAARRGEAAVDGSSVAAKTSRVRDRFRSASPADRLRAVAAGVFTAVVGHVALSRLLPATIAPATPLALWVLVAATAAFAWLLADPLVVAWQSSRLRRLSSIFVP